MFWGLIMEPKRRYSQVVKRPFHISMASLDIFSADDEPTQVMLFFEERNYLLCTLQKNRAIQCSLDLNFELGDKVIFATNGNSNIHLSGYIQEQFGDLMGEEEEDEEEEEEDVDEEEVEAQKSTTKSKKKKIKENDTKREPAAKKSKLEELLQEEYDSDDEDESFVLPEAVESDDDEDEDEDDDEEGEEEEVGEDGNEFEFEDEEMEEEKSDVSSLSEEEVKKPSKQMNGDKAKPQRKKKQQNALQKEISPKNDKKTKNDKTPNKTKGEGQPKNAKTSKPEELLSPQQKKTLEGGVIIQDLKVGDGNIAKPGKMVQVYYEGRLKHNNRVFDQANKGAGFKFRLGKQEVIKGWDIGVAGMKVGGRRRITCPPAMAYGQKGSLPAIGPNATLVFEVELKNII